MKISYNWLCDYIKLNISAERAAEILTAIGLEVEEISMVESVKGGLKNLVIGEVLECEKHPDADKLKITKVNAGTGTVLQIVCGAPNVAAGQKVVVALEGTIINPVEGESFKIKKSKIRGVASEGMLCAEDEIGLGNSHAGLLILPNDAIVGTLVSDFYKVKTDYVFEIGLTPNRSDAMSHIGVARDLCAYLNIHEKANLQLLIPDTTDYKNEPGNKKIDVEIGNSDACMRYSGIVISNITVTDSPEWLQAKLNAIGLRPINNVVDITNFVMHECGQPLHAFDADKIAGKKVIVKTVIDGTKFNTLDEKEVKLSAEDLMICNEQEPMCIAGVYGGAASGVKNETKNIFLESASFKSTSVRRTAQRHQLRTDAAMRFEKGTDLNQTIFALKRAALLFETLGGGKIDSEIIDVFPKPEKQKEISLSYNRVNQLAGMKIAPSDVDTILISLQFKKILQSDDTTIWQVPSHKLDVAMDVDLVEEILRIYGYDQIPVSTKLNSSIPNAEAKDAESLNEKCATWLSGIGFHELMINSIGNSKLEKEIFSDSENQMASLMSYANSGLDTMRTNTMLGGLQAISYNLNRQQSNLFLYECGKTFHKSGNTIAEKLHLTLFATGSFIQEHWQQKNVNADLYFIKGVLDSMLHKLGMKKTEWKETEDKRLNNCLELMRGKNIIARVGNIKSEVLKKLDVKQDVIYADVFTDSLFSALGQSGIKFKDVSKFPSVKRDLALVLDEKVKFETIEKLALKNGGTHLQTINLFDVFANEKLGQGKKSYGVSFVFSDETKTLTDSEIDGSMNKLIEIFERELNANIRKS